MIHFPETPDLVGKLYIRFRGQLESEGRVSWRSNLPVVVLTNPWVRLPKMPTTWCHWYHSLLLKKSIDCTCRELRSSRDWQLQQCKGSVAWAQLGNLPRQQSCIWMVFKWLASFLFLLLLVPESVSQLVSELVSHLLSQSASYSQ